MPRASRFHAMISIESISSRLRKGEDGIWYGTRTGDLSYPAKGSARCLAVEEHSFWFRHRNACILAALRQYPPPEDGLFVDVGGGNGFVAKALQSAGYDVVLLEPGKAGALHAKRRGVETVLCTTLEGAGFEDSSLPACGLFDVLEHIEDDLGFLRTIRDRLVSGGRLYVTVPAYDVLWSVQDDLAGHYRRYSACSLREVLEIAGFEVSFLTYIFRLLPVPIFFARSLPYRIGLARKRISVEAARREHLASGGVLSGALGTLLKAEVRNIERKSPMRIGGSCLVVATRPP